MVKSGLRPEFLSYADMFLLPFIALKRLSEPLLPRQAASDTAIELGWIGRLLEYSLLLESCLIRKRPLPVGVSLFAVGRKSF